MMTDEKSKMIAVASDGTVVARVRHPVMLAIIGYIVMAACGLWTLAAIHTKAQNRLDDHHERLVDIRIRQDSEDLRLRELEKTNSQILAHIYWIRQALGGSVFRRSWEDQNLPSNRVPDNQGRDLHDF